jgi:peptidoglycan/xylan/chitin deacetylase (PgdA/CDA1 family)
MTLDPNYLRYPKRHRGMDHDLYSWSSIFDRPPLTWPSKASVAIGVVVSLEWFPIIPSDHPFRAPVHMQTPYPDYRHYTAREYGTRVGLYRLLDAFAAARATASFATNGAIADRYPKVIEDVLAGGHEIVAHSTDMNGTIATGISEDEERELIRSSLASLERAAGHRPRGWMSIARSQSWKTPQLLAEAGIAYCCDWVNDDLPYRLKTPAGALTNVPINHELSDRQVIGIQQQSAESYAIQIRDAFNWLVTEAQNSGPRFLPIHVTPYIIGLPYRIGAFEDLLFWLRDQRDSAFHTCGEVAAAAP